jgi:hypothetical protein
VYTAALTPPIIDELCSAPGNQERQGNLNSVDKIAIPMNSIKILRKIIVKAIELLSSLYL